MADRKQGSEVRELTEPLIPDGGCWAGRGRQRGPGRAGTLARYPGGASASQIHLQTAGITARCHCTCAHPTPTWHGDRDGTVLSWGTPRGECPAPSEPHRARFTWALACRALDTPLHHAGGPGPVTCISPWPPPPPVTEGRRNEPAPQGPQPAAPSTPHLPAVGVLSASPQVSGPIPRESLSSDKSPLKDTHRDPYPSTATARQHTASLERRAARSPGSMSLGCHPGPRWTARSSVSLSCSAWFSQQLCPWCLAGAFWVSKSLRLCHR